MPDRDPFDKDFGFDEPEDYWQIERPKRKFSLKNHWLIWLLLVNCISFSVILFFYSGGHPIDFVTQLSKNVAAKHSEPSEEELLLEDAQRIKTAVSFAKGEGTKYIVHRYMDDAMWEVYYKNDQIMNARGNSFVQLPTGYYYLSSDRKRLYRCIIDEAPQVQAPLASPPQTPAPRPEPKYEYVDEFYRDSDGTWKNRKREVEVKRDGVSGDPIPKIVYDNSDDPRDVKR